MTEHERQFISNIRSATGVARGFIPAERIAGIFLEAYAEFATEFLQKHGLGHSHEDVMNLARDYMNGLHQGPYSAVPYSVKAVYPASVSGWFSDVKHGLGKAIRASKSVAMMAATATATAYGGPAAGAAAGKLAGAINDFEANALDPKKAAPAKKIIDQAKEAAKTDPVAAKALDTAQRVVAHTTIAHHTKDIIERVAKGDPVAQQQAQQLGQAARQGDPAARQAMDFAQQMISKLLTS